MSVASQTVPALDHGNSKRSTWLVPDVASGGKDSATSMSAVILSTLSAYSAVTKALFATIENPSSRQQCISDSVGQQTWTIANTNDGLAALAQVDQLLCGRMRCALQHSMNQAEIEDRKRKAKARDRRTRKAIMELSSMSNELDGIVRLTNQELATISSAEQNPLGHRTLLDYAQRLARYTSAPPGYKLPRLTSTSGVKQERASVKQDEDSLDRDANEPINQDQLVLGPGYNQYAKRAAAYYDPAMPSMPQEMPFPSDAMMRQGILNSHDLLAGAPIAEQPPEDMEDDQEPAQEDYLSAYSHFHAQQQQQRQVEEEDAFDLDLN